MNYGKWRWLGLSAGSNQRTVEGTCAMILSILAVCGIILYCEGCNYFYNNSLSWGSCSSSSSVLVSNAGAGGGHSSSIGGAAGSAGGSGLASCSV